MTTDIAVRLARHSGAHAAPWLARQPGYEPKTLSTRQASQRRGQPRAAA
ncbi:MAG: hypothetical protein ACN6RD_03780 [Stenotrophomonas maltophilia]